jgi:hypothetical protein
MNRTGKLMRFIGNAVQARKAVGLLVIRVRYRTVLTARVHSSMLMDQNIKVHGKMEKTAGKSQFNVKVY